jgi:glycosyltransferase involved in cell wall biosynthesis
MVRTFLKLNEMEPECLKKWSLLLVGGSTPNNPYLEKVKQCAANHPRIRIKPNASLSELKECYSQAALFWHWCGLNQTDPALVEHFGMTIVEAMQNKVVPVVFDGGGQQEIVDHGVNGFRITSLSEGMRCSLQLIENSALLQTMAKNALQKSRVYNREAFAGKVQSLFAKIHSDYLRADE